MNNKEHHKHIFQSYQSHKKNHLVLGIVEKIQIGD